MNDTVYDLVVHLNRREGQDGLHRRLLRSEDLHEVTTERNRRVALEPHHSDVLVIYKTEINAYQVVMSRERMEAPK